MERVERSMEVDCPTRVCYDRWAMFEELPQWDTEITEQIPARRISWRSTNANNAGTVRFEPLPGDRTLVRLMLGYEPQGAVEPAPGTLGVFASRVETTLRDFKNYIDRGAQ